MSTYKRQGWNRSLHWPFCFVLVFLGCSLKVNPVGDRQAVGLNKCVDSTNQKSQSTMNLVGGEEARVESLDNPLAAVVEIAATFVDESGKVNGLGFCSGTLIGRDVVLTAAHCVSKPRNISELVVNVGPRKNSSGKNVSTLFRSKASMFVSHNGYDPQEPGIKMPEGFAGQNDIAILRLSEPVPHEVPVVAVGDMKTDSKFTGNFLISGHGVNAESDVSSRLQRKREHVFTVVPGYSQNWFDIESKERVQMCVGDSGGSLLVSRSGKLFLVGVFESAPACNQEKVSAAYISRMTRVGAYFDWIAWQLSADAKDLVSLCSSKIFSGKNGVISNAPGAAETVDELMTTTPIADGTKVTLVGVRWFQKKHYGLINNSGLTGYVPMESLTDSSECKAIAKSEVVIKNENIPPSIFLDASHDLEVSRCAKVSGQ